MYSTVTEHGNDVTRMIPNSFTKFVLMLLPLLAKLIKWEEPTYRMKTPTFTVIMSIQNIKGPTHSSRAQTLSFCKHQAFPYVSHTNFVSAEI